MYCLKCGKELPEGSGFCAYCGEKQIVGEAPANIAPRVDTPTPTRKRGIALIATAVVVVIAVVVCWATGLFAPVLELQAGDIYEFGNRKWLVMYVYDKHALLLAQDIVAIQPYNQRDEEVTWENCSLRRWLNDEFYNESFSENERKLIRQVSPTIQKSATGSYDISGGAGESAFPYNNGGYFDDEPTDCIFLLSFRDITKQHFSFDWPIDGKWTIDDKYNSERRATYNPDKDYKAWWLRDPGSTLNKATAIDANGAVQRGGIAVSSEIGVRPAIWINLKGAPPSSSIPNKTDENTDASGTKSSSSSVIEAGAEGAPKEAKAGAQTTPPKTNAGSSSETVPETASPGALSEQVSVLPGMPGKFTFSSGVGAWSTGVTIQADGSFTGYYSDSDMGDTGKGYPDGTVYESRFSGKFTNIKKITDYEYTMSMEYINVEGKIGGEKITDGIKYITTFPYGFEGATVFFMYLPGCPTNNLPEQFVEWVRMPKALSELPDTLPFFGLYNQGEELGFFGDSIAEKQPESSTNNMLPGMSVLERKALHMLFSTFAEVGMSDFDVSDYTDDELIEFAVWHTYERNVSAVSFDTGKQYYGGKISAETISTIVKELFDIKVKHKSVGYVDNPNFWNYGRYNFLYEGGYYYFNSADGAPSRWAQATEFCDNLDGTYTAQYDVYESLVPPENRYEDVDAWMTGPGTVIIRRGEAAGKREVWDACIYNHSCTAVVKPYYENGYLRWYLISLEQSTAPDTTADPADKVLNNILATAHDSGYEFPVPLGPNAVTADQLKSLIGITAGDYDKYVSSAAQILVEFDEIAYQMVMVQAKDIASVAKIKAIAIGEGGYDPPERFGNLLKKAIAVESGSYVLLVASDEFFCKIAVEEFAKVTGTIEDVTAFWPNE